LKAVFLDRDGVINVDKGYIHRWENFEFLPGAIEAMRRFEQAGFALIVVTNQSGIARGFFSVVQYEDLTSKIRRYLTHQGVHLTAIYHCPHYKDGVIEDLSIQCACRKPEPGMLLQAMHDYDLDMAQSVLVGDKIADIEAARAAGVAKAFLVAPGMDDSNLVDGAESVVGSLFDCADLLGLPA
jgi:D-glycero-D-manno-heptose 1,7-bisphosphate phosphatase